MNCSLLTPPTFPSSEWVTYYTYYPISKWTCFHVKSPLKNLRKFFQTNLRTFAIAYDFYLSFQNTFLEFVPVQIIIINLSRCSFIFKISSTLTNRMKQISRIVREKIAHCTRSFTLHDCQILGNHPSPDKGIPYVNYFLPLYRPSCVRNICFRHYLSQSRPCSCSYKLIFLRAPSRRLTMLFRWEHNNGNHMLQ